MRTAVAKKKVAKKAVAKKTAAKKTVAKKTVAKKTVAKKTVAKKTVAKNAAAKKTAGKKTVGKKPAGGAALRTQRLDALNLLTVSELKDRLRANDQLVGGTKGQLVERAMDRIENGCLPRCPECAIGHLRLTKAGGFECPGGYDDDEYVECSYTSAPGVLDRPPWVPEPGKTV